MAEWYAIVGTGGGHRPAHGPFSSIDAADDAVERFRDRHGHKAGTYLSASHARLVGPFETRAAAKRASINSSKPVVRQYNPGGKMSTSRNGYVVYPPGEYARTLTTANKRAKAESKRSGFARVENADTEKTVSKWRNGKRENPASGRSNPARRSNPKSISVKNFTGTIQKLANGTVLVKGRKK
jgi:hypothetical protein